MALEMSFTDEFGDTYAQSYWRVAEFPKIDKEQHCLSVTFHGYENAAKKGKRIIGTKRYDVDGEAFNTYFPVDASLNIYAAAYVMAKATPDEDGSSFFGGAVDA